MTVIEALTVGRHARAGTAYPSVGTYASPTVANAAFFILILK
jgi:hypothetical protein